MTPSISRSQQFVLESMRLASFNAFDGDQVVDDLIRHRDLWISCLWMMSSMPLRPLLYLSDDFHQGDTLYILTTTDKIPALEQLAQQWSADTFKVIDANDEHNHPREREELEEMMGFELEDLELDSSDTVPCVVVMWWD